MCSSPSTVQNIEGVGRPTQKKLNYEYFFYVDLKSI